MIVFYLTCAVGIVNMEKISYCEDVTIATILKCLYLSVYFHLQFKMPRKKALFSELLSVVVEANHSYFRLELHTFTKRRK